MKINSTHILGFVMIFILIIAKFYGFWIIHNENDYYCNSTLPKMSDQDIQIFNSKFQLYEGEHRRGREVKVLLNIIKSNNKSFGSSNYQNDENEKIDMFYSKIKENNLYSVSFTFGENAIIEAVNIKYLSDSSNEENFSILCSENNDSKNNQDSKKIYITGLFTTCSFFIIVVCIDIICVYGFINKIKKVDDDKKKTYLSSMIGVLLFINIFIVTTIWVYNNNISNQVIDAKPIIYIYPEEETAVTVELGSPEKLTCVYPSYDNKWEVVAEPDGTLIDEETGRKYYALYWEGKNTKQYGSLTEGFVVEGKDTAKFLEEKLEILGLNEREAEEFIVYWLPQLEKNKYNYIRFQTADEINENMPLNINPKPETMIRVMMEWKALDTKIEVKKQQLEKIERKGYTVVEWGGTEIKDSFQLFR